MLALTAIGAGVFAVTRSALSLAVLSMVGAFIAPAFAVEDPGPQVVYRYYVAISLLVLAMVAVRGWRPLIHLSFLFTLAGGAFFAWTADYAAPTPTQVLLPLIAMLVAVHVAMPLFERHWAQRELVQWLDTIYILALPAWSRLSAAFSRSRRRVSLLAAGLVARRYLARAGGLADAAEAEGMATHSRHRAAARPARPGGALSRAAVGAARARVHRHRAVVGEPLVGLAASANDPVWTRADNGRRSRADCAPRGRWRSAAVPQRALCGTRHRCRAADVRQATCVGAPGS